MLNSNPCGLRLYSPTFATVSATGNEEAPSKEILGGICWTMSEVANDTVDTLALEMLDARARAYC